MALASTIGRTVRSIEESGSPTKWTESKQANSFKQPASYLIHRKSNYTHLFDRGVTVWLDKRRYKGTYKDDKKHGYGIFEWTNSKTYAGEWQFGKQHGKGITIIHGTTDYEEEGGEEYVGLRPL